MKRTPLKRSTTPIARSPLKRGLGRLGKIRAQNAVKVKAEYFTRFGKHGAPPCQWTGKPITQDNCIAHHKLKRSLGGKDNLENYLILSEYGHNEVHANETNLRIALISDANSLNGLLVKR